MRLGRSASHSTGSAAARWASVPNQILAILCLMYFTLYIDRVNIATVGPRMTTELGLTNTQFGLAISAFSYPYALMQLLGGQATDRFGSWAVLLVCGAMVCATTVCTGLVGGVASLFALRLMLGISEGFAFPAATRAIATWLPPTRWARAQGITHAAARLGNALTPPFLVGLMSLVSWRGSFVVLGLASAGWVILWAIVARKSPSQHPGMSEVELRELSVAGDAGTSPHISWWQLARRMAPVTAVDFCYGWTLWVFLTWLPSFFVKNYDLDLAHSALFSGGILLGGVVGDWAGGMISDRIYRRTKSLQAARRNVIVIGMAGAFVFLLPVALWHDLTTVALCLSAAFFFLELVVAPIWAIPMDIASQHAATASGMMNFGFGFAGILSPLVFGALVDSTGSWSTPFFASLLLLLVGAGLSFFMRPDRPFEVDRTT